jgi:hypothetical protein
MAPMEFSYTISEAEYIQAGKLYLQASRRGRQLAKLLFWLMALGIVFAFWGFVATDPYKVTIYSGSDGYVHATTTGSDPSQIMARIAHTLVVNFGPIAIFVLIAIGVYAFRGPVHMLRRSYGRDPVMRSEFTVDLTPEFFSGRNSAGTSWQNSWALYESWREDGNLIILILRNQSYDILNLAGLSDPQRAELRALLAAALPQK